MQKSIKPATDKVELLFRALGHLQRAGHINWLYEFADSDLAVDLEVERCRWLVFAYGFELRFVDAAFGPSGVGLGPDVGPTPEDVAAHPLWANAMSGAPGIDSDRIPVLQIWVRRFLRSLAAAEEQFTIPVPVQIAMKRGPDGMIRSLPAGDTESVFFGAIAERLKMDRYASCQTEGCGRLFAQRRKDQIYCSKRCQNRASAARFRRKQRKRSTRRGATAKT